MSNRKRIQVPGVSKRPYIPGMTFTPPATGPAPLGWHCWQWSGIEESISRRADPVPAQNIKTRETDPTGGVPACAKREAA